MKSLQPLSLHQLVFGAAILLAALVQPAFARPNIEAVGTPSDRPVHVAPGGSFTLQLTAPAQLDAGTRIEWLRHDTVLASDTVTLARTHVVEADTGNYRARLVSASGKTEYSNTVVVNVLPPVLGTIDNSFVPELPTGANPDLRESFPDGSMIVATSYESNATVVRLRADGSRDPSYVPPNLPRTLARLADGGAVLAAPPYRINADGSVADFTLPASFESGQPLTQAIAYSDGRILLAQRTRLARLLADGRADPAFSFANPRSLDSLTAQLDARGRILVSGTGVLIPGQGSTRFSGTYRLTDSGAEETVLRSWGAWQETRSTFHALADGGYLEEIVHENATSRLQLIRDAETYPLRQLDQHDDVTVDPAGIIYSRRRFANELQRHVLQGNQVVRDPAFSVDLGTSLFFFPRLLADGRLLVNGVIQPLVRLRTTTTIAAYPSVVIRAQTSPQLRIELSPESTSSELVRYEWLALDGQPLPADRFSNSLVLGSAPAATRGRYQLRASCNGRTILSNVVDFHTPAPFLAALSGRAFAGAGDQTLIAGVTLPSKGQTLLRGIGPSLGQLGVNRPVGDPELSIFDRRGQLIAMNSNWGSNSGADRLAAKVGAFSLAPDSLDAALPYDLPAGGYTLHLTDRLAAGGVALLEIYAASALDDQGDSAPQGLALRAHTAPGEQTAIAGFVIRDPVGQNRTARVLLRISGPALQAQGVANALADPQLLLFNAAGTRIAANDNWHAAENAADISAAIAQLGLTAFPTNSRDSALLLELPPGAYTLHAAGGTGVVLLEIYSAP